MNTVKTITPPTTELLLPVDVKAFLKIDHTDDDAIISMLITAARDQIQKWTGVAIGEQLIEWKVDVRAKNKAYGSRNPIPTAAEAIRNEDWCGGGEDEIDFPLAPVISVATVTEKNGEAYQAATLNQTYFLDGDTFRAGSGRYKITYTAGYDANTLPAGLKLIWRQFVVYLYTNRQDEDVELPAFVKYALQPYKRSLI